MGVCCVKQHNQDTGEFDNTKKSDQNLSLSKNDNKSPGKGEVAPFHEEVSEPKSIKEEKKEDEVIERASKKVVNTPPEEPPIDLHTLSAQVTSENARVRELEDKLGPFKPPESTQDSIKRETRGTAVLDNGAHYIGQW